ncbi:MAG TPA: hypothetical protein VHV31_07785 [Nitrolancea sp.]|nr:hypothetical protein [Nitrolancea sp.]
MNEPMKPMGPRRWQARIFRIVNVPMRLALRLPFPTPLSRQLMLLSYRGRKSGKAYQQPVSYVPDGETLLTPGGGKWKLNLREGEPIHVHLRGRDVLARPEFVRDIDEVVRLLKLLAQVNPRVASFVPVIGAGGEVDRDRLKVAIEHGFSIIRWHVDGLPTSQVASAYSSH